MNDKEKEEHKSPGDFFFGRGGATVCAGALAFTAVSETRSSFLEAFRTRC